MAATPVVPSSPPGGGQQKSGGPGYGRIVWLVLGGTTVAAALFAVKSIRALRAGRWALGV
jgi:hypothetical protein